jgi:hypothetical protein
MQLHQPKFLDNSCLDRPIWECTETTVRRQLLGFCNLALLSWMFLFYFESGEYWFEQLAGSKNPKI